jgi:VanZ family protein
MFQRVDEQCSKIIFWQISFWSLSFWIIWCIATTLMLLPADELPVVDIWDKAEHAFTFFVLMLLGWLGYRKQLNVYRLMALLISYGIAIECIQYFIPSRSFSVLDMVADSVGVVLAFAIFRYWKPA